ncbi:Fibronectin type III domain protein [Rasamsonia emersonii CBS 393.64]|uniref:Fibronectin type III domain protein n=1 Tax=Rasamsonia emersonii (strain ATCC 16479 / CBS 393.64 / IMI 116815) TaxID=1408163 RepID=A0A0F4Z162_RASE3|nr:Fibronectin type III domain protein [Rasamsonia emersonii CBS 393.64]KKA24234.1 Fibronectin type III domain protein [Rasamsonia emersonii CBS 393.64]
MALFLAATILWALVWLLYRAWQVCQTPNEILVDKLGLDIPPAPEVTLEEISAREIRIAWKQPDFHNSIHKHIIQINNSKVGETKRAETAVAIGNLIPGHIYHICVFAVSAANFQTASAVLHVRTKPLPLSQTQQDDTTGGPTIRASVPRPTPALVAPAAPIMAREHSGGQVQGKRSGAGRKLSPAATSPDTSHNQVDDAQRGSANEDTGESLEQLAERLKTLQHENEAMDKQINDEEEEHNATLKELEKQRDELKQRVKEKDEASGDLKKHVNKLESVNRTVQSEKTKRERLLQQKEAERKKRKDDIARWQDQIAQMNKDITRVREEKARVEAEAAKQANEIREKIAHEQAEMKSIDEEIQEKGGRIKKLEEERKRLQGGDSEDGKELDRIDTERARQWEIRLSNLQARYATLVNLHAQAQQQYQEAQERLKWLNSQRANGTGPFAALQPLDLDLSHAAAMRRPRHRSSLTSNVSSPVTFPQMDPSFPRAVNYNPPSNNSPTFAPSSAFFNITNGMTFSGPPDRSVGIPAESDISTSNAPMSPRADALLPSDLLGDEESSDIPEGVTSAQYPDVGPVESAPHGSPSPVSSEPRSATFFTSPHSSLSRLRDADHQPSGNEEVPQGESSSGVQSASRRLSGLFGFHRQRGKTLADGPPLLGTLKPGQSRSFPKNFDDIEPIGSRRRRLSYTGNWANAMSFFPRSNTTNVTADSSSDHMPSRRSAFANIFSSSKFGSGGSGDLLTAGSSDQNTGYNQFSPRHDPIDPSSILGTVRRGSLSPRPSSTFSFDNQLPHPSTEPFGWPSGEAAGQRSSLGFDWASPAAWSRTPSRRPSTQYGSSSHLPLGISATEPDFLQGAYEKQHRPLQAPIGTRPSSSHRPVTPKLNPAAPSFKTLFSKKSEKDKEKGKEKDRDKDKEKEKDKDKDSSSISKFQENESTADDSSPPASRRSKDSRSLSAATESYDSLDLVTSSSPVENGSAKESFIQKITRKSSSSKFNLSWKDRAGIFSKKNDSNQGDIDEDANSSEAQLGKSVDSAVSSTASVEKSTSKNSRSFFTRKSKKSDKTTSESSEKASETGDEEPEEEVVS